MKHLLEDAGAAFAHPTCVRDDCLVFYRSRLSPVGSAAGDGHAVCSCGERSPHLSTYRARKRWHNAHKAEMAEAAA